MPNLKEELMKSIGSLVDELTNAEDNTEDKQEEVQKSFDEVSDATAKGTDITIDANGGGDVIKNKDDKEKKIEKMDGKKKPEDKEDGEEEEKDEDKEEKAKKAKKSLNADEVAISKEQYARLEKALAEDAEKERLEKSLNDPLFKSLEGLTSVVKSLKNDIDDLKKQPARDPKSLRGTVAIQKSGGAENEGKTFKKSEVLDALFELQKSNKCTANHIIEFETTKNISDRSVKAAVEAILESK